MRLSHFSNRSVLRNHKPAEASAMIHMARRVDRVPSRWKDSVQYGDHSRATYTRITLLDAWDVKSVGVSVSLIQTS